MNVMFWRDINESVLLDEAFQIYSFSCREDLLNFFFNLFIQEMKDLMISKRFFEEQHVVVCSL